MISNRDGQNLVFIAGCPRSGTTYLQRMLAALPGIKTSQELHLFDMVGPIWRRWQDFENLLSVDSRGGVGLPLLLNTEQFRLIFLDFIDQLLEPVTKDIQENELFVEKTPSNALFIDVIQAVFPNSRIINIQRDARDVVASLLAASRTWGKHWAPRDSKTAAELWRYHILRAKRYSKEIPKDLYYEIKFEELVENPTERLSEICVFLGVTASPKDVRGAVEENTLEATRSSGGTPINQTIVPGSSIAKKTLEPEGFIRKGKIHGWKKDLTLSEKFTVWRIARSAMKQVGYEWAWPW